MLVGHSYFGSGEVLKEDDNDVVVDFGYPYGIKTVATADVSVIENKLPQGEEANHGLRSLNV